MDKYLLYKQLSLASKEGNSHLFKALLKAISEQFDCKMCSLWEINHLSNSVSIIAREKYYPDLKKELEFVHSLKDSLIGHVLKIIDPSDLFFEVKDITKSELYNLHKSKERIQNLELRRFICIPIPLTNEISNEQIVHAVINIYLSDKEQFDNECAQIIRDYFLIEFSKNQMLKKQELTQEIVKVYREKGQKDINSILHPIISNVFLNYFKYEGSSIFIWNHFLNRFNLAQTTGLENTISKSDVYYKMGEGLTGHITSLSKPQIINDLNDPNDPLVKKEYVHKYREKTVHFGKTLLVFPILKPSNPEEIIGIIRFTNKINRLAPVLDFFTELDLDIVSHGCNLIGLYIENYQSEQVRTAFTKQLGHEMLTPAIAIRGTVSSLIKKWMNIAFIQKYSNDFLNSILNHSELQIAQATTIEYIRSGEQNIPKSKKYHVTKCDLLNDILIKCKKLVIPIAIDNKLIHDNIYFSGSFPSLYIDKYAFEPVFFNLLTNAIKYRNIKQPIDFKVNIHCEGFSNFDVPCNIDKKEGYLIRVRDYGIGISSDEVEKIFLLGYRKKGIEKTDVRGLGIGLHVVKAILSDFYCTVWVSNLSNPTEFSIFIPELLSNNNFLNSKSWKQ